MDDLFTIFIYKTAKPSGSGITTCLLILVPWSQLILTLLWQYTHQNFDRPRLTFCLILGKKRKIMARSGFGPTISRSEVDHANHYSINPLLKNLANILMKRTLWWDKKWVLACQSIGECTARVKLELTDSSIWNWSRYFNDDPNFPDF